MEIECYPQLKSLVHHREAFWPEFEAAKQDPNSWHEIHPGTGVSMIPLFFFGEWSTAANTQFLELKLLLSRINGIICACLSCMAPHTAIPTHEDPMEFCRPAWRCHLGLEVTNSGILTPETTKKHANHEWIVFDHGEPHSAFNHSDKHRYILIVDMPRPTYSVCKSTTFLDPFVNDFLKKYYDPEAYARMEIECQKWRSS